MLTPHLYCFVISLGSCPFFFFPSAWVICPLHPLGYIWLTALDARPSQLRLVTQKKISVVLGNRFSKYLRVYYVPVAFPEVITTNWGKYHYSCNSESFKGLLKVMDLVIAGIQVKLWILNSFLFSLYQQHILAKISGYEWTFGKSTGAKSIINEGHAAQLEIGRYKSWVWY